MKFHPNVLRCHEQFGGDLADMQRRYDAATKTALATPPPEPSVQKPVAWMRQRDIDDLAKMSSGATSKQIANYSFDGWTVPVFIVSPSPSGDRSVKVKPLEWKLMNGWWYAPTAEGQSYVLRASLATNFAGQWLWDLGVEKYELAPSLEAAKAAAQADYEQRILSALVSP